MPDNDLTAKGDCCAKPNIDGETICYHSYCRNCGTVIDKPDHGGLVAELASTAARLAEAEAEIEQMRQMHATDIRRLESAIQLHVIMKAALHGDEVAKKGIIELAEHIKANDAALRAMEGSDV